MVDIRVDAARVAEIFTAGVPRSKDGSIAFTPELAARIVEDVDPAVEEGWLYDETNGSVAPAPPDIAAIRDALKGRFEAEGMRRAAAAVPDIDSLETLKVLRVIWSALEPSRRSPALKSARDVFIYADGTAAAKLDALTTLAELEAVDPAAADPFGDGTAPWPT